ncbi:hypothetical protein [Cellulomonas composti]|uniref:Uncharacterized protein n=1 Tax=Cellulomonas composti TaxID=266130 RepID=A0A511JAI1_9CELL|nr:hypothetical protein [Cellulomonas composti]GEL95005.1 hypothetical protein CCO02nite_16630 [Cellulomonas composti]
MLSERRLPAVLQTERLTLDRWRDDDDGMPLYPVRVRGGAAIGCCGLVVGRSTPDAPEIVPDETAPPEPDDGRGLVVWSVLVLAPGS